MAEVVGVRFKTVGKIYYFIPGNEKFNKGDYAIVETARGIECGEIALENTTINDEKIIKPLKPVLRKATQNDIKKHKIYKEKEKSAIAICEEKVEKNNLKMKIIDAEYAFDGSKIIFYFTADGRVDFRTLVKDLASVFRTRIELRQIGVRDESKMLGGFGICGRPFCCNTFMGDFQPVSIKMAKEQGLSLNPVKISGSCSRLMCCLKYEQPAYDYLLKITPKSGAIVKTENGKGTVMDVNLLTGILRVRLDNNPEGALFVVHRDDVKLIKDSKIQVEKSEIDALKKITE